MNQSALHSIEYGNGVIEYRLVYTERETLAIHVLPDTNISVEAPLGSEFIEIEQHIRKRATWILRQQRNFRRYSFDIPPRQYVSGESYRYLGRQYQLKVIQGDGKNNNVKLDREHIIVTVHDKNDHTLVKKMINNWYRQQGLKLFTERIKTWLPRFERYEIGLPRITVRPMRAQWGSCSAHGKLSLNIKLIQVPKPLMDYVIVHELCHLIENNHSPAFYALLSRIMPDWQERREKLNSFEF